MVRKMEILEFLRINGKEYPMNELCNRGGIFLGGKKKRPASRGQIWVVLKKLEESGMVEKFKKDDGLYYVRLSRKAIKWVKSQGVHSFYDIRPKEKKFRKFRRFDGYR
ncbi:MAG: hypothetical protein ACTSQ8_19225 [Candidatus Helarchaeota archaeon]